MSSAPIPLSETPPNPVPGGLTNLASETMGLLNKKFIGAVEDDWIMFSDRAHDYTIGVPIGYGASSIVYAATWHPSPGDSHTLSTPTPCALKVLDLDSLPRRSLQLLQRETKLMSLSKHPNVLRVRGSWIDGHKIYIALRLMNKGSAADVMQYGWPGGMEEEVVRCILRQALEGLNYLHINGFIHRDIKAANLLIDDDGTVLLGDLGVAADLSEDSSHPTPLSRKSAGGSATAVLGQTPRRAVAFQSRPTIIKRKSFVGTPCWMAPELIAGKQYDSAADIWSFGITALELCQGRPPRSRESSKDVFLRIIHEAPPTLDREHGVHRYSRNFKEMIDSCLVKDPSKRPSAEQLLQTPFFKGAKKKTYLINTILKDLPLLTHRQQRHALRHPPTVATIDSWDFASTIHSPTSTIHCRGRQVDDLPMTTPEREDSIGVFHFDEDESSDPQEENHSSTSSSSSNGGLSTDPAAEGLSTPPTNASSFSESLPSSESPKSDPARELSSFRSKEVIKKGFWSRISSRVKRPSVPKVVPSLVANSESSVDIGQAPFLSSENIGVKQKGVPSGSSSTNSMKRSPKTSASGSTKVVEADEEFSSGSRVGIDHTELPTSSGWSKDIGDNDTRSGRPRSSRANVLGEFIGEAKQKLLGS